MSTPGTYRLGGKSPKRFLWQSYPKAQAFLDQQLSRFLIPSQKRLSLHSPLQETIRLRDEAAAIGIRFFDLLEHVKLASPSSVRTLLEHQGFSLEKRVGKTQRVYRHSEALFPALILEEVRMENSSTLLEIAVKSENLEHLKKVRGYTETVGDNEKISLKGPDDYTLTFVGKEEDSQNPFGVYRDTHIRLLEDPEEGFDKTVDLVREVVAQIGKERAAYEWAQAEVRFWEARNRAATLQGNRQREIGLGWANKDHITYRNSKAFFPRTIEILEYLGFEKRERLDAEEFTAQVMEHKVLGISAFVDVDPPEQKEFGTVGLWVKLHGESMLSAGLHHMAARYDFLKVQEVLKKQGVHFRPPFSNFEDLKQVFTEGEKRPISERRARRLFQEGIVTENQMRDYITEGAVYTHLENIQRGNGFKGFNQRSVNKTLRDTGRTLRSNKK